MPRGLAATLTILVALVVGGAVTLWRSRTPPTRVIATLPEAPGMTVGSPVEYRGIRVGSIEDLRFTESAVTVTLRLDRSDIPLRNTDRVGIRTRGIGERAIAIIPSREAGEPWAYGDTLKAMPPEPVDTAREAAARAIFDRAVQAIFSRDSAARARPAAGASP